MHALIYIYIKYKANKTMKTITIKNYKKYEKLLHFVPLCDNVGAEMLL